MSDRYAAIAAVWDEWQEAHGPFWRLALPRLEAALAGSAVESFLELGCGTGALLCALAEAHPGWRLCGVDASAAMLAQARRKPRAGRIRWVEGDFDADVGRGFHAAGSFFDALNHAAAPGDFARACAGAARALAPAGLFVFDLNNRLGFETWWRDRRVYPGPGWTLIMEASFDGTFARGRAVIERRTPAGARTVTEVLERCIPDDEVRAALAAAGFDDVRAAPWAPLPGDVPGKTWWTARRALEWGW